MKIIAAYNLFNGLEIFQKSVEYTKPFFDELVFFYQTISYRGNKDDRVIAEMDKFADVNRVQFNPDNRIQPKQNELIKQNQMMEYCKSQGADYMLLIDADHIYQPDKIEDAIKKAIKYDVSFTRMLTYYKHSTWQLETMEDYYMPFLIKLYPHTKFANKLPFFPVKVDPTLKVNTFINNYIFDPNEFLFHHYSLVRNDIYEKFKNSPSRPLEYWKQRGDIDQFLNYDIEQNPGVNYFGGRKIKIVPDYFDIKI
jgi:hypothetical protein